MTGVGTGPSSDTTSFSCLGRQGRLGYKEEETKEASGRGNDCAFLSIKERGP